MGGVLVDMQSPIVQDGSQGGTTRRRWYGLVDRLVLLGDVNTKIILQYTKRQERWKNQMSEIQQTLRIETLTSIQRSRNGSYTFDLSLHRRHITVSALHQCGLYTFATTYNRKTTDNMQLSINCSICNLICCLYNCRKDAHSTQGLEHNYKWDLFWTAGWLDR